MYNSLETILIFQQLRYYFQYQTSNLTYMLNCILKLVPPRKNSNKMNYGMACQQVLINCINNIFNCKNLDEFDNIGYKYDIKIENSLFSIKTMKKQSSVILINKRYKQYHNIYDNNYIIIDILNRNIYMFKGSMINEKYITDNGASISLKSSFFTNLKKYSFSFIHLEDISSFQKEKVNNHNEINITEFILNQIQ